MIIMKSIRAGKSFMTQEYFNKLMKKEVNCSFVSCSKKPNKEVLLDECSIIHKKIYEDLLNRCRLLDYKKIMFGEWKTDGVNNDRG